MDKTPPTSNSIYERTWALVENGIVEIMEKAPHEARLHPFGDLAQNQRAIDVTKVECHPGYLCDEKGNVAPSVPGRTEPLLPGEPAYHERGHVAAEPTAVRNQKMYTAEPHPLDKKETFSQVEDDDVEK